MNTQASSLSKALVVIVLTAMITAVFTFYYGKSYQQNADKIYRDSLQRSVISLQDTINRKQAIYKGLNSKYLSILGQLKQKKVEYIYINEKYDKMANVVSSMPADDQIKFFANWVSKADTTGQRQYSSNN